MTEKLLNLLNNPKNNVCWYPNSGDDFEVMRLWDMGYGNEVIPNLYILTHPDLDLIQNHFGTEDRLKNDGFDLIEKIKINHRLSSVKQIDWAYANIDWSKISEEKRIEILKPINGELSELLDMGFNDIDSSYFDELSLSEKLNLLNIIEKDSPQKSMQIYQNGEIKMVLLNCKSNEFYDFCIDNKITIENAVIAGQLNERGIDPFLHSQASTILRSINAKNVFVDTGFLTEEQHKIFTQNQIDRPFMYTRRYSPILGELVFTRLG